MPRRAGVKLSSYTEQIPREGWALKGVFSRVVVAASAQWPGLGRPTPGHRGATLLVWFNVPVEQVQLRLVVA